MSTAQPSSNDGASGGNDAWRAELAETDRMMRMVSTLTDPQEVVNFYGDAVNGAFPSDDFVAVSRRDLASPKYRITRSSRWSEDIDPWAQRDRLPVLEGGLLGRLLYGDAPVVLDDYEPDPSDPAYEHLKGTRSLLALPNYDNGQALNMTVMCWREPKKVDHARVSTIHWQSSLVGRTTLNMVLRRRLAQAYEDLDRELLAVAQIQRALLPERMPEIKGATLAARYETSARAGGDSFDAFPLPDGKWGLFIADVSGHGTPAAVGMAITHALSHAHPGPPTPPEKVLAYLNTHLSATYAKVSASFVTAIYAVYDPATGVFEHASAGHPAPRLVRGGRVLTMENDGNMPLGIDAGIVYPRNRTSLERGDLVLFYTDGITETFSPSRVMFGVERLDAVIAACGGAQECVDAAIRAAEVFSGEDRAADDRTAMCLAVDSLGG